MAQPDRGTQGTVRIGVYICHCGTNIAGVIDAAALAGYAAGLPGVALAREYKYMCSDPGQELIRRDIAAHELTRIVVAACSPHLHERTFHTALETGGLNPYYFQMVNIREHGSWVHASREAASVRARDQVRAAVLRVAGHRALHRRQAPVHPDVLIAGGGIAGIHAALTIANAGKRVYLVERGATIGGHMAQFDKTFPTLDCAACILTPKMTAVRSHRNITLWTMSEVSKVEGYVGNYRVTVRRRPRYVREDLCTGCQECIDACVFEHGKVSDEFNAGLSKRKPVYMPFPQAVPQVVAIDPEACIEFKTGKCKKTCIEACGERGAINLHQREIEETVDVGALILATGFKTFDPRRIPYYGYGEYPNVYTALEVERLVNAAGPTAGEVLLRDGRKPRTIGIVHCVGSRDENTNRWCSRVCCMYSLKLAHLLKEKTGAEIYSFYIDIRAPGKAFEEFYNRVAEEGVIFVRGRVADIYPEDHTGRLIMQAEDTLVGGIRKLPVDMVVLAAGLEPGGGADEVRRLFNITCARDGFFLERHPKLAPVSTFTDGIFLAGCCQGPKDIPDTVAQAGAAAAEALALADAGRVELEPNTAYVVEEACSGCKTCVSQCPYTAIKYAEKERKAAVNEVLCKGCGTCVAACPSGSIRQNLFEDEQIFSEIEGVLAHV
jgi:heterodisulfide reductase subunit A